MIKKIQGIGLALLLSVLNGNILLSMQKIDLEPKLQATKIDQCVRQESYLLCLPAEVIAYIIYQIIKPYEDSIESVNNIFEFYCQVDLKQLKKDLIGVAHTSKGLRLWTLDLINRLKKKHQNLVNPIKDQYQGLSLDELNRLLRNILNQFPVNTSALEEAVKLILSGANVNEKNKYGYTALMRVAIKGHKGIVQLLVGCSANVNEKDKYGDTALTRAAINDHKDIVQLLIDNGANVNDKNDYGNTALVLAAWQGHKGIVQLLIDNDANVNQKNNGGDTALMWAARLGHKDILKLLIDNGANVNQKNDDGATALMFAKMKDDKNVDVINLLKYAGAKDRCIIF